MKKNIVLAAVVLLFTFMATNAIAIPNKLEQPTKVTFYANEAELVVKSTSSPQNLFTGDKGVLILLPANASLSSLVIKVDGLPSTGYYRVAKDDSATPYGLRSLIKPSNNTLEENAARRSLLEKIDTVEKTLSDIAVEESALNTRLRRLQGYSPENAKNSSADDLRALDALLEEKLLTILKRIDELEESTLRNKETLELLGIDLVKMDAGLPYIGIVVPFLDNKPHEIEYAYSVPAQTSLLYRLDAEPQKGIITLEQSVSLSQYSGFTWDNPEISIFVSTKDRRVNPQYPFGWGVSLIDPKSKSSIYKDGSMDKAGRNLAIRQGVPQPQYNFSQMSGSISAEGVVDSVGYELSSQEDIRIAEQRSTSKIWQVGKSLVKSGVGVNFVLNTEILNAKFYYIMRPSQEIKGFLAAELDSKEPLELGLGNARFFVDGTFIGDTPFSFNGNVGTIYFGNDPLVTSTMIDKQATSGESGFFSKESNMNWHWEIITKNARSYPVDVRIEDPRPVVDNESLKVVLDSKPAPSEATTSKNQGLVKVYRWDKNIKSGETFTINHKVQVTAPGDKVIGSGR